jgi:hypothetical protein
MINIVETHLAGQINLSLPFTDPPTLPSAAHYSPFATYLLLFTNHQPPIETHYHFATGKGVTFQIRSQYSRIERSEENFPIRATLRIALRVHPIGLPQRALT